MPLCDTHLSEICRSHQKSSLLQVPPCLPTSGKKLVARSLELELLQMDHAPPQPNQVTFCPGQPKSNISHAARSMKRHYTLLHASGARMNQKTLRGHRATKSGKIYQFQENSLNWCFETHTSKTRSLGSRNCCGSVSFGGMIYQPSHELPHGCIAPTVQIEARHRLDADAPHD